MALVFAHLSDQQVRTYQLVLDASGILYQTLRRPSGWNVTVPRSQRQAAVTAVRLYLQENHTFPPSKSLLISRYPRTFSAFYIVLCLITLHAALQSEFEHEVFVKAYGADAAAILSGQLYRCITAMLFHADWAHLVANAAGLLLFGTAAAAVAGWGIGWLLILVCGAGGNLLTAIWYGQGHLSIGASTAVFAAVGLCSSFAFSRHRREKETIRQAWLPIAGGLAFLGFMGASKGTDLLAHLFGFCCGLAGGAVFSWRVPHRLPCQAQWGAAALLVLLVAGSWALGMQ
jgi:membrane associated rhomboid family serine protease